MLLQVSPPPYWHPGRPHQLWQQVFLAETLAWDTPTSISMSCIHTTVSNISYPVVIQGFPQFSHKNDEKIPQIRPNPIPSIFSQVIIHQFVEHSVLYCVQLCNHKHELHQHRTVDACTSHVWFRFSLTFHNIRLPVSLLMTRTKVIHTKSLNLHVALSHWPLNTMLLH